MDIDGRDGAFMTDPLAEVVQSLRDRLLTPVGTRVLRPTYGSQLPTLAEGNYDPAAIRREVAVAASAEAHRYELTDVEIRLDGVDVRVSVFGNEVV